MAKKASLPAIVSTLPNDVRNFLQRVREMMDGFVTTDALVSSGIVTVTDGGNVVSPEFDFTPPPAHTGLVATGTITSIMLSWDSAESYSNYAYTEIWRSGEDNIGTAVLSGQQNFNFYVDTVDPSSSYYYWIRIVSRAKVLGPFNALAGTHGTTSADPSAVLDLLSGAITSSELHSALGTKISLIDAADTVSGSVAARIKAEADARTAVDGSLQSQINMIAAAGTGDLSDLIAAVSEEQTARISGDTALGSRIDTVVSVAGDNAVAIETEATTRASQTGELYGQYTVKIDAGGKVSGYGLASSGPVGAGSIFEVRADRIAFFPPYGSTGYESISPFVIDTVNARVAMDGAFIKTATIGTAAIENLAVTDAKMVSLQVGKLTSGDFTGKYINLGTGGNIRSGQTAFNTGTGFWMGKGTDGYARLSVGSSTASGLDYDQAAGTLNVRGKISVKDNSDVGGSTTVITGGSIESGQTAFNVGTGFWIGKGTDGYARFSVGNPTASGIDYSQSTGVLNIRGKVNMYSGSYINGVAANNIASWADSTDTTQINGGYIKTRTIDADSLKAKSITAASGVIGDLAVDTLQLAGRAVTIPVTTQATSQVELQNGIYTTVLSAAITCAGGQPVIILWSIEGSGSGDLASVYGKLSRDGVLLSELRVYYVYGSGIILKSGIQMFVDYPIVGPHTYTLQAKRTTNTYASASTRKILVIECKR